MSTGQKINADIFSVRAKKRGLVTSSKAGSARRAGKREIQFRAVRDPEERLARDLRLVALALSVWECKHRPRDRDPDIFGIGPGSGQ